MNIYDFYNPKKNKLNLLKDIIDDKNISSLKDIELIYNNKMDSLNNKIKNLELEIRLLNRKIDSISKKINFKVPLNFNLQVIGEIWKVLTYENYGTLIDMNKVYFNVYDLYIPEWNVTFNITFNNLNIHVLSKKRYNNFNSIFIKEIRLDTKTTFELYNLLKLNDKMEKIKVGCLDKIKKIYSINIHNE